MDCQTRDGLNIETDVAIGVSILEANSAKYLSRFGLISPVGDRTDPKVIFTSVYYSRKLDDVTDDVGRKKILSLICNQIGIRTFNEANNDTVLIMEIVQKQASEYFLNLGITLDFLGWAGPWNFDKEVQASVNRKNIAGRDEEIAKLLAPHTETIRVLAAAEALQKFGDKTDGKLPTTIVGLPTDIGGLMEALMKTNKSLPVPK